AAVDELRVDQPGLQELCKPEPEDAAEVALRELPLAEAHRRQPVAAAVEEAQRLALDRLDQARVGERAVQADELLGVPLDRALDAEDLRNRHRRPPRGRGSR